MKLITTISNTSEVMCAAGAKEYIFVGLAGKRVMIIDANTYQIAKLAMTKRDPISMTILDKRLCVCGLKNHAWTSFNFKNDFKQVGMTYNMGNDWVQVVANSRADSFYRVWKNENMTIAKL